MRLLLKDFFSTKKIAVETTFNDHDSSNNLISAHEPQGLYCDFDSDRVGLFVAGDGLFLYLNGTATEIREQQVTASLQREGVHHRLELTIIDSTVAIVYDNLRSPVSTQFYAEDEEDSNFGLWLTNVLGSEVRRDVFRRSWSQA